MMQEKQINKDYTNNDIKFVEKTILIEENNRLKQELNNMTAQNNNELEQSDEMEF